MASPLTPERVRVLSMTWEADGVLSLVLADPAGGPLPSWTSGAHVNLDLAPGLRRSYSLSGNPADERRWQVAVLRETAGRGGSEYVHARLRPGDLLTVSGPRNNVELRPAAEYLFIAGGIGISPAADDRGLAGRGDPVAAALRRQAVGDTMFICVSRSRSPRLVIDLLTIRSQ